MKLAKYQKTPAERKRYTLDYTDWLDTGETVSAVVFAVDPTGVLFIDSYSIVGSGRQVVFYANAGATGVSYTADVRITTSTGQIKEDQIVFVVKDI